mmetsp:Transcript_6057/g.18242  ORF Transcript_6057/g.18242 Transcript_6057/m.18242 type:complete len:296 (+) Transcript_6057:57-944(+)
MLRRLGNVARTAGGNRTSRQRRRHSGGGSVRGSVGGSSSGGGGEGGEGGGSSSRAIVSAIAAAAHRRGLDLAVGLTLQDYNALVGPAMALPELSRSSTLAVLVGSTRDIWTPFLRALRQSPTRGHLAREEEHGGPLNAYVVRATEELAAEAVPRGLGVSLHFAHETAPGRLVAMQRLAHLSGAAYFHAGCGLNVHPTFGPWHAYRSLVVVAADGVETAGPPPNPSSSEAVAAAEAALQTALAATIDPTATNTREELVGRYREAWRLWQRVRQCVSTPEYDAWKYPDAFDEYHFSP